MTHYELLGVDRAASAEEVRRAYVARARQLHPDRSQGLAPEDSARTSRAMQDVNEAWRVLRSPASRSAYDERLAAQASAAARAAGGPAAGPGAGPGEVDLDPTPYQDRPLAPVDATTALLRSLPWVAVLLVLGAIFVVTAFAGGARDDGGSSYDLVGSCVQSQRGVGVVQVPCSAPNEGRVELVVGQQGQCPDDAIPRPVPGQGTWVCLRPAS